MGADEKLTFNNLYQYHGYIPAGYGGFNWLADFDAIFRSEFPSNWCDNGWTNVARGSGEAFLYEYGFLESASLQETFSLKSMIAASAWNKHQVWDIASYTYHDGSLHVKANDQITIGENAEHIDFSKIGGRDDFRDISAVAFALADYGSGGNTCSYGYRTNGVELVFDNLRVHWNGKNPPGAAQGHMQTTAAAILLSRAYYGPHSDSAEGATYHHNPGWYDSPSTTMPIWCISACRQTILGHRHPALVAGFQRSVA